MLSRHALLLLCLGCAAEPRLTPARPGSEYVLELGKELEIAYSPLWCRDGEWLRVCTHLSDSGMVGFHWDHWHRPLEVTRQWGPVSALHGVQVRDSLRQAFERRGARRFSWPIVPDHTSHGTRTSTMQWCVGGAVATVIRTWEDRRPVEWVGLLVSVGPERDCSSPPQL